MSLGISTAGATHTREVDPLTVTQRLQREGRWKDIEPERDEMMRLATKGRKMSKVDAQQWTYAELDRLYPPIELGTLSSADGGDSAKGTKSTDGGGPIQGLAAIHAAWPELQTGEPCRRGRVGSGEEASVGERSGFRRIGRSPHRAGVPAP